MRTGRLATLDLAHRTAVYCTAKPREAGATPRLPCLRYLVTGNTAIRTLNITLMSYSRTPSADRRVEAAKAPRALIGRDTELARIVRRLELASGGQGHIVMLAGEPGIGKTRLGRELLARASAMGMRTCLGRSFEQHTTVPFFPFTEALTLSLSGQPLLPDERALQRWPELARLLVQPDGEQLRRDQGETQLQVFRAATAFLREAAQATPLVLLLDDLHWADATSLSLLLYLGRHLVGAPIMVLGTYRELEVDRQHPLAETLRELIRDRLVDELAMRRLAPADTAALIRTQLGGAGVSASLAALIHSRAEGNPFFTEELIRTLFDRGAITEVDGIWTASGGGEIEVPRSVRSVIGQRLDRLSPETRAILQLASVIGQEFEFGILLLGSERVESPVMTALDAALDAGLLGEQRIGGVDGYRFAHALVQQSLYEELPSHRRRDLHRRIGDVLEGAGAHRRVLAAQLARHFLAAGDTERAQRYTIEAGDQAALRYAHAEAAGHYQLALKQLEEVADGGLSAEIQFRLGRELYDLNRLPEALAAYQAALGGFELVGDSLGQARVHRGIGLLNEGRYERVASVQYFSTALEMWPADSQDAEFGWLLLDASRAMFYSGDCVGAGELAERGLALAERCGDPGLLARALGRVATNRMIEDPRPSAALPLLDRAERVARASNEWRAVTRIHLSRADQYCLMGDWELALADRRLALEAAERSGEVERVAFAYHDVAEVCRTLGRWQEGRAAARAGLELDPRGLLTGVPGLAQLTWMEGRPDAALQQLRAHVADARRRSDLQGVALNLANIAELLLQMDLPAEADAPAREAAELLRVGGAWQPWPAVACGPWAETVVRLATPDMDNVVAAAEAMVAATEQNAARPQVLRARGLWLEARGELGAAIEVLVSSAGVARSQHASIQLGCTLDALARVADQHGDAPLANATDAELEALVRRIGPEVTVLAWTRRVTSGTSSQTASTALPRSLSGGPGGLTTREREVAALVARGLTNRQIAEKLVIADGTAGVHVDHILSKLGFRSRAQVAAWAVEKGLVEAPPASQ